jgi:prepilin-type N-terminal cleavage/methylation domain-containing protein
MGLKYCKPLLVDKFIYPNHKGGENMKMNDRNQSGFTLIELLVVIVIIGILAAIALPNYIKARNKAREAEVKSNIHSIQLALERYATDNSGVYPTFLTGGERNSNILACSIDNALNNTLPNADWPMLTYAGLPQGVTPYAVVAPKDANGNPNGRFGDYDLLDGDALLIYGYLSQYPRNPFARRDSGLWNSQAIGGTTMTGLFPYGGEHGDVMFDLSFGWGDAPQTDFVLYTTESLEENDPDAVADPDLDAPGNFYYHPTFSDGIPLYFHSQQLLNALIGGNLSQGVYGEDVLGFFLYGYGAAGDRDSLVEGGQDVFNRMPAGFPSGAPQPPFPNYAAFGPQILHGVNALGQARSQCTGYNSTEFDPYTGAYPDGLNPRNPVDLAVKSGSDGIQDWVVIVVAAGSDQAPDFVRDTLTYGEQP